MKKIILRALFALGLALVGTLAACGQQSDPVAEPVITPTPSAYRELLDSEIRGMDDQTIEDYLTGKGMGMALPAELNGYPGPRHVIDLADELSLTPEQTAQTQALFDEMQPKAIALGTQILAAEAALEEAFRTQTVDETNLEAQLQAISLLEAQLRYVHLRTHLATLEILNAHQIMLYNSLRGYDDMPANHNQHQHEG
ncbi:MAG TPA: periplasmic heavy metal sensor [Chloroflexota bacterium]|nr:periplasmic heavy metal sensor [Chloroflexota bacterium]HUM70929.1 periplasmic heavy metal sensor [Chloroflexota bacterium]